MRGSKKFPEGVRGITGFARGEDGGGMSLLSAILPWEFNKFEFFEPSTPPPPTFIYRSAHIWYLVSLVSCTSYEMKER